MIVDTDIGGDPDDTVALTVATLTVPHLALVVTTDEYGGQRARFARHLLDVIGRHDVPVVEGSDLGNTRLYVVDGLFPSDVPRQRSDLVERMVVTQMGGAIVYRDPTRAEHNFRVDPAAASHLLSTLTVPALVVSDVTFNSAMEITAASPIYRSWTAPDAPPWARILKAHHDRWMQRYPGSMQHDGLTLAAALLWPGVRFARERVVLDELGRMSHSDRGQEIAMSIEADYDDLMSWLADRLNRREALHSAT